MIRTKEITKRYGDLQVLKGISLAIREGEVVSVVGASGAGKTTLLQIIGTLSRQNSGTVEINGIETSTLLGNKLARFRNMNIGFVFQFHQLLPEFTAHENVCIPGYIAKNSRRQVEKRGMELLDFLGLSQRTHHKPGELSGGEQQRVAIARALINDPAVILADEPSGNLDTENKNELHSLFFRLRDEFNKTLVIVTHDMHLAEMADRMVRMKDGLVVARQEARGKV
ncbi:MAG: ABC transporter ATP-binding protein [Bacteroidales bacterium]|nr:ABC transporter ATP-binding protein [Bacteroidales bacterium]MDT8430620.1 ABC transporter ATP-binding protein [Bacteroidales bacterium]